MLTGNHVHLSADAQPELLLIPVGEDPSLDFWSPSFDGGQGEPVLRAFFFFFFQTLGRGQNGRTVCGG